MSLTDPSQLAALRQRVPVGLRHGQTLLARTGGDVPAAEALFRAEMQALVVAKTGVASAVAERHLQAAGYDINLALKRIDEERYTLTERILRRYHRDKEEALRYVAEALAATHQLPRQHFWFQFGKFPPLAPPCYCLLVIMDWLAYDGWEGFDSAVYYNPELITKQLEQLGLPEIARVLRQARAVDEQDQTRQKQELTATGSTSPGPVFRELEARFRELEPQLMEALYQLVQANIRLFP